MVTSSKFFLNSRDLLYGVLDLSASWKSDRTSEALTIRASPSLLVTYTLPNNAGHVKRKKGNGRMWIKEHLDRGKRDIA